MNAQRIGGCVAMAVIVVAGGLAWLSIPAERPLRAQQAPAQEGQKDLERRVRELERRVDDLMAERRASSDTTFWDDEARTKAAIWSRLVQDGYIGRYDCPDTSPDKFAATLYRRYMKRRPTDQEMKKILESYGPGGEQVHLAPEVIVRRMLSAPGSPNTPLEESILHAAGQTPPAAPEPGR